MRFARSVVRSVVLASLLLAACLDGWIRKRLGTMQSGPEGAVWVHGWCRRIVHAMGITCEFEGSEFKGSVAVVSNHLSYLDILMYSARQPFVMVAKSEVRAWPLIGWITAQAGTVYVQRADVKGGRTQTHAEVNALMAEAFASGLPVVFFPEGTTTDGSEILPFRRGLFHSVLRAGAPVGVAGVAYSLDEVEAGMSVEETVCYWGEMEFVPHLFRCLGLRGLRARVRFEEERVTGADRFALARNSRQRVVEAYELLTARQDAAMLV